MNSKDNQALILFLLSPLEKQIIRGTFYNKVPTDVAIENLITNQEYKSVLDNLMQRLSCENQLELGIWATQNAKLWANKNDLIKLNLIKYQAKEQQKRIVILTEDP